MPEQSDKDKKEKQEDNKAQEEPKKGAKIVKILIIVLAALGVMVISFGAAYIMANFVSKKNYAEFSAEKKYVDYSEKKKAKPLNVYSLENFLLIITDEEGPHNFKSLIDLGIDPSYGQLPAELGSRRSQMRDIVNTIILRQKAADLRTPEGLEKFKYEIQAKINDVLTSGKIEEVYLNEFVVQ